jgi:riboflavin synthase
MFSGIVERVGRIVSVVPHGEEVRVRVDTGTPAWPDVAIGDSVAVAGCCLTVVEIDGTTLGFDVSAETLRCTTGLDRGGNVNLELALRLGDRLGGHLVTGHIDGVGTVRSFATVAGGDSFRLVIVVPSDLSGFIAPKGSIAVAGVSLTVNAVDGDAFVVNLIPHTLAVTTLGSLEAGGRVNIEIDLVARYVARLADAAIARTHGT